eukprot:GHVT01017772.1.p2 GENE.GHVT01017772.1~~GHVT01017772.1.p2  ORF type:complete len:120 (+),score=27.07 GHVT01017772.1:269-628(+)
MAGIAPGSFYGGRLLAAHEQARNRRAATAAASAATEAWVEALGPQCLDGTHEAAAAVANAVREKPPAAKGPGSSFIFDKQQKAFDFFDALPKQVGNTQAPITNSRNTHLLFLHRLTRYY